MSQNPSIGPQRTILYYPTISIPNSSWLRQALLYFDKVASIVPSVVYYPREVREPLVHLTSSIEYLQKEGVFRRIPPEFLFLRGGGKVIWKRAHRLTDEFMEAIDSKPFKRLLDANKHSHKFVKLHKSKLEGTNFNLNITEYLLKKNLIKFDDQYPQYGGEWFRVEENTALLYMSLLAQALADIDKELTVTGTDRREYERLVYDETSQHNGFACLDTRFINVLPIPRADVPFAKIVGFKQKRRDELRHFQQQIDELQRQLSAATEQKEIKEILLHFSDSLKDGLSELTQALHEGKIATIMGSFKCLMNVKSPTAWVSAISAVALLAGVHIAAAPLALPAIAVVGTVEVECHLITKRNEKRAKLRDSPFTYLYHAHAEGLLDPIE
jgi:hypothetical protein